MSGKHIGFNICPLVTEFYSGQDRQQTHIRTQATCDLHGRVFLTKIHCPLNFSKNIVSLVHHGAYCALVMHIAPS